MVAVILLVLPVAAMIAQEVGPDSRVPTNLEVIQKLSRQIGDSLAVAVIPGDSVRVTVRPVEAAWYIESGVLQAFRESGRYPTQSLAARSEVELGLVNARVEYANVRRAGFLGSKVLDRTVIVEFLTKVVDKKSGEILASRPIAQRANDVIELSEIEALENGNIPATRGTLPREGFFSTILEPLVAIGTIAVAVYLLFHVRS